MISRRCQFSTKTNYTTYSERRSAPVRLFIRQPPVQWLLLHTNIIALEALYKSEQGVIKHTSQMAFGCDSELLLSKVLHPLRTYPDKTSFHAQFQEMSVRLRRFKEIRNQNPRFVMMRMKHQSQKQRSSNAFLFGNDFHLSLLARQTCVNGVVDEGALEEIVRVGHHDLGGCCPGKYDGHRDDRR